MLPFRDRKQARQLLAKQLQVYVNRKGVLILTLPRGGVPVAFEVAKALQVPMDLFLVRSIGVTEAEIDAVKQQQQEILEHRNQLYREGRKAPDVKGKTVILIDDGIKGRKL